MHLALSAFAFNIWRATHRRKFLIGILKSTFSPTLSLGRINQHGLDGRILFDSMRFIGYELNGAERIKYSHWQFCGHPHRVQRACCKRMAVRFFASKGNIVEEIV